MDDEAAIDGGLTEVLTDLTHSPSDPLIMHSQLWPPHHALPASEV